MPPLTTDGSSSGSTPQTFGPFRVLHQLGAGTLGPVFRAHDPAEGRLVAVKAFRLDLTPERAADIAAALNDLVGRGLNHPSIATALAAGVEGATPWLAQSYVPAESLDGALRQYGPAPIAHVLTIVTHVAGTLDFAAAAGVTHGSLHPRDVLVSPEETHVIDFGVAAALEQCGLRAPVRRPYSAPERVAGSPASLLITGREADVFALAAVAFELLTGQPITGTDSASVGALPDIPGADPGALGATFAAALAADPLARPATALAFASALKAALGTASYRATPAMAPRRSRRVTPEVAPPALPLEATDEAVPEAVATPPAGIDTPAVEVPVVSSADPVSVRATEAPVHPQAALEVTTRDRVQEHAAAPSAGDLQLHRSEPQPRVATDAGHAGLLDLRAPVRAPQTSLNLNQAPFDDDLPSAPAGGPVRPEVATERSFMSAALLIVLLTLGTAAGFAGGWVWATRQDAPSQETATPMSATGVAPSAAPTAPAASAPRTETESVISPDPPPPVKTESPAAVPRKAPAAVQTTRAAVTSARASRGVGRILIRSTPAGAAVEVDGRRRGTTPLTLDSLSMGGHSIVISRAGYLPERRRLTLTRGRPSQSIEVPLREAGDATSARAGGSFSAFVGSVLVESRPGAARVILDGREVGRTPLVLTDIRAGSHVVRLELDGYRTWTSAVQVVAGERRRVAASLEDVSR